MGILDNLGDAAAKIGAEQGASTGADPKAALVQAVLGMLLHGNTPGGLGGSGGFGGLSGLLQRFQSAGLGPEAGSWVGNGPNLPVSADQVRSVLGDSQLRILAEHVGLDEDKTAIYLSRLLPKLVDRLTPNGQLPETGLPEGGMAGAVESLGQLFANRTDIL